MGIGQGSRNNKSIKPEDADNMKKSDNIMDSSFIPLDELVYAPLYAVAESDQKLRAHVIEVIKSMGSVRQNGQEEIIHLDNINIAYDQLRQEADDGYNVENLQLQIPLLSIVPVTNLNMEKAEIDFSTEVRSEIDKDGKVKISGRICSPEQRNSNFLPRVSYHMGLKSIPATEGIMRLTDILSSNQIAKQLDTTPIDIDGSLSSDEKKDIWQRVVDLRLKIKKLKRLYQKVTDTLAEQERLYQISDDADHESTYQLDKGRYMKAQSDITNLIMKYQEEIILLEIDSVMHTEESSDGTI